MFKHFITLEWKSFTRSASLGTNIAMKILMGLAALYFICVFTLAGVGVFFLLKNEANLEPLITVNKFIIYYLVGDLVIRYFFQKMPVMNIKPLLTLPIKRNTIVHFTLGKTSISFFNVIHAFFFVPFTIVLLMNDYSVVNVLFWHLGIVAMIYANNFINVLINNRDVFFYPVLVIVACLGISQYYNFFDITQYTTSFFHSFYSTNFVFLIPITLTIVLYYFAFTYFKSN